MKTFQFTELLPKINHLKTTKKNKKKTTTTKKRTYLLLAFRTQQFCYERLDLSQAIMLRRSTLASSLSVSSASWRLAYGSSSDKSADLFLEKSDILLDEADAVSSVVVDDEDLVGYIVELDVEGTGSATFCCSAKCFDTGLRRLRRVPNLWRVLNFFFPIFSWCCRMETLIFEDCHNWSETWLKLSPFSTRWSKSALRVTWLIYIPGKGFLPISCEESLNCGVNFLKGKISSVLCVAIFAFVSVREGVFHPHKAKVAQLKERPTRRCATW